MIHVSCLFRNLPPIQSFSFTFSTFNFITFLAFLKKRKLPLSSQDESELSPCQFEPPANAVLVRRDPRRCTEIPAVIGYYECAEGYSWLSGAQYHEAHCIGRLWKPILDLCVADCGESRSTGAFVWRECDVRF